METLLHYIFTSQKITRKKYSVCLFAYFFIVQAWPLHPYVFASTDYVKRFATEEALRETEKNDQSSDESSMSDFSEDETKDMEL